MHSIQSSQNARLQKLKTQPFRPAGQIKSLNYFNIATMLPKTEYPPIQALDSAELSPYSPATMTTMTNFGENTK